MEIVLRYFWRHKESRALYYNQSNIIPESFENLSQETFPIFAELTKTAQAPIIGWTLIPNYKNKFIKVIIMDLEIPTLILVRRRLWLFLADRLRKVDLRRVMKKLSLVT